MNALTRFDTNTLAQLNRALVGFDRMFDNFEVRLGNTPNNYPPHNVIQIDDTHYVVEVAVAGFAKDEIDVELKENVLTVRGEQAKEEDAAEIKYLHKDCVIL